VISRLVPVSLISHPNERTSARLARQSAAAEKFMISDLPLLQAVRIAARCEMDLSLGTWQRPNSGPV
jgi:hypothetical protein